MVVIIRGKQEYLIFFICYLLDLSFSSTVSATNWNNTTIYKDLQNSKITNLFFNCTIIEIVSH